MYRTLQSLDLALLVTFRTFASEGTVAKTAAALGRTQPAISTRLRQLEHQLGASLLKRVGRRLHLTPLGRQVRDEIDRLLPHLQRIADLGRHDETSLHGIVRVGSLPTAALYRLLPCLPKLRHEHSALRIELEYGVMDRLTDQLAAGDLDLLLGVGQPPTEDVEVIELQPVRPVRVTRQRGTTPKNWVAYGPAGDPFFDAVWNYMEDRAWTEDVTIRIAHIQTLKSLVMLGLGQTILPEYTVVEKELQTFPLPGFKGSQRLWCATRTALSDSPAIRAVVDALTEPSTTAA